MRSAETRLTWREVDQYMHQSTDGVYEILGGAGRWALVRRYTRGVHVTVGHYADLDEAKQAAEAFERRRPA